MRLRQGAPLFGARRRADVCCVAAPRRCHTIARVAAPGICPSGTSANMPTYSCTNPKSQEVLINPVGNAIALSSALRFRHWEGAAYPMRARMRFNPFRVEVRCESLFPGFHPGLPCRTPYGVPHLSVRQGTSQAFPARLFSHRDPAGFATQTCAPRDPERVR